MVLVVVAAAVAAIVLLAVVAAAAKVEAVAARRLIGKTLIFTSIVSIETRDARIPPIKICSRNLLTWQTIVYLLSDELERTEATSLPAQSSLRLQNVFDW